MVSFRRSQHYLHSSLLDEDGVYRHKPLLIIGSSGKGKSIYSERSVEEIEDNLKKCISILPVDILDTIEGAFTMFPATETNHVNRLNYQHEEPKARRKVKLWCFCGKKLKDWQKKERKLPEMELITLSAKNILKREECMFLCEADTETKSVRLMMRTGEKLKQDEDLRFADYHGKRLTKRKTITYMGKRLESDVEPVGSAEELKDVISRLHLFNNKGVIMPDNYKTNFNVQKLFKEPDVRHVFVYKGLENDKKLREFIIFHILMEIKRNITDCKYPINLVVEETGTLMPYKGKGYKAVFALNFGDIAGTLRKAGVSIFMVGRVWSKIADEVKDECSKQILFHLEQNDMLKFVKVRNLGKKAKLTIEKLQTGEYVHRGNETRICISKMPKHGHKHETQRFMTEYKKFFKEKMRLYTDEIKELEEEQKNQAKKYNDLIRGDLDKRKAIIRSEVRRKQLSSKSSEEVDRLREQEKSRKETEKLKRDNLILNIKKELEAAKQKISYRIIAKKLSEKGIKISYVTVKNVLDNLPNTERVEKESSV